MTDVFALYDAAVSVASAVGLLYLLYSGRFAVAYDRFFRVLALGLLAFAVVSVALAFHPAAEPIGALAGPFVLPACYLLVRRQLLASREDADLDVAFDEDALAERTGDPGDWPDG